MPAGAVPWSPGPRRARRRAAPPPGHRPRRPVPSRAPPVRPGAGRPLPRPRRLLVRHSRVAGAARRCDQRLVPVRSGTRPSAGSFMHSQRRRPAPADHRTAQAGQVRWRTAHRGHRHDADPAARYPAWQPAIHSSNPGSTGLCRASSPGTPSGVNRRRSIPAENEGPAPCTTTTRTSGGSARPIAASPCHIRGVMALRRWLRSSVMVAAPGAGAPTSKRSPARARSARARSPGARSPWAGSARANSARAIWLSGRHSLLVLRPRLAAVAHRGHARPVLDRMRCTKPRPAGGEASDGYSPRVVPLLQIRRQLGAVGTGDPGAFLKGLGHAYLP